MKVQRKIVPIIKGFAWQFPMRLLKDFDSAPALAAQIFDAKNPTQKLFQLQTSDNTITVEADPNNAKRFIFTFHLTAEQTATISNNEVLMEMVLIGNLGLIFITRGRFPVWTSNYQS